jgi:hypothetical protein
MTGTGLGGFRYVAASVTLTAMASVLTEACRAEAWHTPASSNAVGITELPNLKRQAPTGWVCAPNCVSRHSMLCTVCDKHKIHRSATRECALLTSRASRWFASRCAARSCAIHRLTSTDTRCTRHDVQIVLMKTTTWPHWDDMKQVANHQSSQHVSLTLKGGRIIPVQM